MSLSKSKGRQVPCHGTFSLLCTKNGFENNKEPLVHQGLSCVIL